ncbi:MAG: choice-of-anchor D domain-containing protein [Deltaproteobacteria bacterium]|nr:choice-of-anchor D domain-containing protein [Deltaproteobacteria bacterium]
MSFSPTSADFANCHVYASKKIGITIRNSGPNAVTITGTNGPNLDFSTDIAKIINIPAGGSERFFVTFNPQKAQYYEDALHVTFHDDVTDETTTKSVKLMGSGVFGVNNFISVASSLNFGDCVIENQKKSLLRFFNNSENDVQIEGQALPNGAPFEADLKGKTIPAHGMLDVVVTFKPTSIQDFRATLQVLYGSYVPSSNIVLTGSGVYDTEGVLETPSRVDFGSCNIGRTKKAVLLFVNRGSVDIEIQSVYLPYEGIFSEISGTIPAFESKEFLIEFTPNSLQSFSTVMRVIYKNGVPASTITLTGTGAADPEVAVAPSFIQFGKLGVGMTRTETVVLSNKGDVPVDIRTVEVLPSGMFTVSGIGPGTLAVGESQVGTVTFNPAAAGSFSALLRIVFDNSLDPSPDGGLAPFEIQLEGSAAEVLFSPETLDFSGSLVGEPVTREVTITNSSDQDLQVMSVATGTADFTFTGIVVGDIISSKAAQTCMITFNSNNSGLSTDEFVINLAPVQEASIPENEVDMGTRYSVPLQAIPNVDFTPTEYDTFTADRNYRLSISASNGKAGQLYVLMSHAPLSNGAVYAVAADGTLHPFPYQSTSGWQDLWYQKGTAPGTIVDLSTVDLRSLGCDQCQGPEGEEEFNFGDIVITHPLENFNNASEFKYMSGVLFMATYVKDPLSSTGKTFDFNQGLLEVQTLNINSLAGTWRVTSRYYDVDRVHPGLLVVNENDGQISAHWPPYPVNIGYMPNESAYEISFTYGGYDYRYRINKLTGNSFAGSYTCYYKGQVVTEDQPVSGVRVK